MMYSAQDLFDYSVENECPMDAHEIMEAMSKYPFCIKDAFDYYLGVPEEILNSNIEE